MTGIATSRGRQRTDDAGAVQTTAIGSSAPRRVLYVECAEDHTVGGSHQALFDLVCHLDRSRYEPVVLFYQDNPFAERLRARGIEVLAYDDVRDRERSVHLSGRRIAKFIEVGRAIVHRARLLRRLRIDLLHLNNSPWSGYDDWLPAGRISGIPVLANAMGDAGLEARGIRGFLIRRYDRVVTISRYITDAMLAAGIPRDRIRQAYLGVDIDAVTARVRRSTDEVRRELDIPSDRVVVAMVGNLRRWKGQHVVLEALRRVDGDRRNRLVVVFIGSAGSEHRDYEASLRENANAWGLGDVVRFLGGRSDVPDLVHAADLALHASILPEPFGLVVVEAMALGRPVIAAGSGGPAEVITPDSGLTFDPAEPDQLARALESLAGDPELRARLGQGARRRVESFTVQSNARLIENVYAELIG